MKVYVQHYTNYLPSPVMKVGGTGPCPIRPTLHWSLLGVYPFKLETFFDFETGKNTIKKICTFLDCPTKYAIIEAVHRLSYKIIGGTPDDLYSFGEHEPSDESYIFIPTEEKNDSHKKLASTIIYYDGNIVDAVMHTSRQNKIPMVVDTCLMISQKYKHNIFDDGFTIDDYDKLEDISYRQFIDCILSNDISGKQLCNQYDDGTFTRNFKDNGIAVRYAKVNITHELKKSKISKYIYLDVKSNSPLMRYAVQINLVDLYKKSFFILFFNGGEFVKFDKLFKVYDIPVDLINKEHGYVLYKMETEIYNLITAINTKIKVDDVINIDEICDGYDKYLNEKLSLIPEIFRKNIEKFFSESAINHVNWFIRTLSERSSK